MTTEEFKNLNERITEKTLFDAGFVIYSQCLEWIDYKYNDIIVSTEMSINGGGFNCNGAPVYFVSDLQEIIDTRTLHGIPLDYVCEAVNIFKVATGKKLFH